MGPLNIQITLLFSFIFCGWFGGEGGVHGRGSVSDRHWGEEDSDGWGGREDMRRLVQTFRVVVPLGRSVTPFTCQEAHVRDTLVVVEQTVGVTGARTSPRPSSKRRFKDTGRPLVETLSAEYGRGVLVENGHTLLPGRLSRDTRKSPVSTDETGDRGADGCPCARREEPDLLQGEWEEDNQYLQGRTRETVHKHLCHRYPKNLMFCCF